MSTVPVRRRRNAHRAVHHVDGHRGGARQPGAADRRVVHALHRPSRADPPARAATTTSPTSRCCAISIRPCLRRGCLLRRADGLHQRHVSPAGCARRSRTVVRHVDVRQPHLGPASDDDPELVAAARLDPDRLPALVPMNGFIGEVTRSAASDDLGIDAGVPVTTGTIDSITSAVGSRCARRGRRGGHHRHDLGDGEPHRREARRHRCRCCSPCRVPSPAATSCWPRTESAVARSSGSSATSSMPTTSSCRARPVRTSATPTCAPCGSGIGAAGFGRCAVPALAARLDRAAAQRRRARRVRRARTRNTDGRTSPGRARGCRAEPRLAAAARRGVRRLRRSRAPAFGGGGAQSACGRRSSPTRCGRPVAALAEPRATNARGAAFLAFAELGMLDLDDVPSLLRVAGHSRARSRRSRRATDSLAASPRSTAPLAAMHPSPPSPRP